MKTAQERVRSILHNTIVSLCENGLAFEKHLRIEGVIGITTDGNDVFIVHINQLLTPKSKLPFAQPSSDYGTGCNISQGVDQQRRKHMALEDQAFQHKPQQRHEARQRNSVPPQFSPFAKTNVMRQSVPLKSPMAVPGLTVQNVSHQRTPQKSPQDAIPCMPQLERYSPQTTTPPVRQNLGKLKVSNSPAFMLMNNVKMTSPQTRISHRELFSSRGPNLQQRVVTKPEDPDEIILLDDDDVPQNLLSTDVGNLNMPDLGFKAVSTGLVSVPDAERNTFDKAETQSDAVSQAEELSGTIGQTEAIGDAVSHMNACYSTYLQTKEQDSFVEVRGDTVSEKETRDNKFSLAETQNNTFSGDATFLKAEGNVSLTVTANKLQLTPPDELKLQANQTEFSQNLAYPEIIADNFATASLGETVNQVNSEISHGSISVASSEMDFCLQRPFVAEECASEDEYFLPSDTSDEEWQMDEETLSDPDWSEKAPQRKRTKIISKKQALQGGCVASKQQVGTPSGQKTTKRLGRPFVEIPKSMHKAGRQQSWKLVARFACTVSGCSASFSQKYNLFRHQKKKHGQDGVITSAMGQESEGLECGTVDLYN